MADLPAAFPVRFQCVGGAVVTTTARPGATGRIFSLECSGCGLTYELNTEHSLRHWRRSRRRIVPTPAELAHFEALTWNAVHVVANSHAASCRRIP